MMKFGAAFADVMDFGAAGDGAADDTAAIQDAIDDGRQVIFPQGTYRITSVITFYQNGGRCQMLSGAVIVLDGPDAYVRVGPRPSTTDRPTRQTFTDLCIHSDGDAVHSPLLEIDQAGGARFDDLRVTAAGQAEVLVRATFLTRCQFFGGVIDGGVASVDNGTSVPVSRIGLSLETTIAGVEEVGEVGAQGLKVIRCETALQIIGPTDNPVFVGCHFGATTTAVAISCTGGGVFNLNLVGCAFSGESCNQFIYLDDSGSLLGGVVSGCRFGPLTSSTARVFRMYGTTTGFPVTGCFHDGDVAVWEVNGSMTKTCDQFNHWSAATVADGVYADKLILMNADETGALTITSDALRLDSDKLGFFNTTPAGRQVYTVSGTYNVRTLTHLNVFGTLATLISDLKALGLIA